EFEIFTDDQAHPHIGIKRVFSCAQCRRLVTSAASKEDVYPFALGAMSAGRIAQGGHLTEPNNFEYECSSLAEYRGLIESADAAGTTVGRGAGFVAVGAGRPPSANPAERG